MIWYFSATGNSQHVAFRLGGLLDEKVQEITHETVFQPIGNPFVLVIPNYFWGMPQIVVDLIKETIFTEEDSIHILYTCGGSIGTGDAQARRLAKPATVYTHQLVMETSYILWHEIEAENKRIEKLMAADREIPIIAQRIREGRGTYQSSPILVPLGWLFERIYQHQCRTHSFFVTKSCIGCGNCANKCPDQAIRMESERPKWIQRQCQHCLRCLHRCPTGAIEYGKSTIGRERYTYPGSMG